jgi:hypothetical protein
MGATVAHGFRKKDGSRVVEALDTGKEQTEKPISICGYLYFLAHMSPR